MRVARWILASGLIVAAAPLFAQIVVVGEGSETIGNTVEKKQVGRAGGISVFAPGESLFLVLGAIQTPIICNVR